MKKNIFILLFTLFSLSGFSQSKRISEETEMFQASFSGSEYFRIAKASANYKVSFNSLQSWIQSSFSGGTLTNFASGNLSPLFTTSVTSPTTSPSQSFTLSNAAAHTVFSNTTGSSAAPSYGKIDTTELTLVRPFSSSVRNLFSATAPLSYDPATGIFSSSGGGVVTSVGAGYGMNFTTITTTGNVTADTTVLIPKASRSVITSQKTFTDSVTIGSNFFKIRNPDATFQYTFKGSALTGSRALTLPLATVDDTLSAINTDELWSGVKTFIPNKLRFRSFDGTNNHIIINSPTIAATYNLSIPTIVSNSIFAVNTLNNFFTAGQTITTIGGSGKVFQSVATTTTGYAGLDMDVSSAQGWIETLGSGWTPNGIDVPSRTVVGNNNAAGLGIEATNASGVIAFATGGSAEVARIDASGRLGVGVTPTAYMHTKGGSTTIASLNIPTGSHLSTKVDGAIYRDATDLYIDSGTVEYVIPHGLKSTITTAFGGSVLSGATVKVTGTVTGARIGDIVFVGDQVTNVNDDFFIDAYVSASDVVTLRATNLHPVNDYIPVSKGYKIFIIK